jgi:hypothetical protein
VITLLPAGRPPTSHRILRADTASGLDLYVDLSSSDQPFVPPVGNVPFIINGPEFQVHTTPSGTTTNEPWDAFDDSNIFLTRLVPNDISASGTDSISTSVVKKVGFVDSGNSTTLLATNPALPRNLLSSGSSGFAYGADNDGDRAPISRTARK